MPEPDAVVAVVCSVTLVPVFKLLSIAVAAAALMVRSMGSMRQEPPDPATTFAFFETAISAPEVSIEPPDSPAAADASRVPLTSTSPARIPASSVMVPL